MRMIEKFQFFAFIFLMSMSVSCSNEIVGKETPPPPIYPLCEQLVSVGSDTQILELSLRTLKNAQGLVPITFIREDRFLDPDDFYQFENHSYYDLGRIFGGLDAVTYYKEQGYGSYPNSRDFMFRYKWLGVTSFVDETDGHNKIIIEVEENTSNKPRWMFIHFYNGEWGFLGVEQEAATSKNLE